MNNQVESKTEFRNSLIEDDFSIQPGVEINPSIIVERIDCFRRSLFQIVKAHHQVNLFQPCR